MHGWINFNKDEEVSSNSALYSIKKLLPKNTKIGFVGTLDPFASGVLPIAINQATKTIFYAEDGKKSYEFTIKFGFETDTLDFTGKQTLETQNIPTKGQILEILPKFTGKINQKPPQFSAIKVNGKRAYSLARGGEIFELKTRQVEIFELKFISFNAPFATFSCTCSKGTYIRSLAKDIALELNSLGHLTALKRTQNGKFLLKDAISYNFLVEFIKKGVNGDFLLPVDYVLDGIPVLNLTDDLVEKVKNGVKLSLNEKDGLYKVFSESSLTAIVEIIDGVLRVKRNFNL